MANYAIIENNKIVNIIIADSSFIESQGYNAIDVSNMNPQPHIGYDVINGAIQFPVVVTLQDMINQSNLDSSMKSALVAKVNSNEALAQEEIAAIQSLF